MAYTENDNIFMAFGGKGFLKVLKFWNGESRNSFGLKISKIIGELTGKLLPFLFFFKFLSNLKYFLEAISLSIYL